MALLFSPGAQFLDSNGDPVASGSLTFYSSGTTNPKAIYTDPDLTIEATNPYTLDSSGRIAANLYGSGEYTVILKTSAGATVWSRDDVFGWSGGEPYYERTAGEIAAGVTPVDYSKPVGWVTRYGINTTPGTTDMTAAIQAAIDALGRQTQTNPGQSGYAAGGGTVFFPTGIYLVTDTLYFGGSMTFKGDGNGRAAYIKFRPASSKTLFEGGAGKETRSVSWWNVSFEGLMFGGDLFSTGYANRCLDFTDVSRWNVRRCYFEQFNVALYKERSASGSGYYHVIDHCEFYDNMTHIYDNGSGNPTTVLGGVFWNFETDFPGTKPSYLIYNKGHMAFIGTSFEPRTAVEDEDTFACIYCDGTGAVSLNGVYSESQYPVVSVDMLTAYFTKTTLNFLYPYGQPWIRLRNFKDSGSDSDSDSVTKNRHSIDNGTTPKHTDLIVNPNLNQGSYGFTLNSGPTYATTFDSATKFMNSTGILKTAFTDRGASTRMLCTEHVIPAAKLTPYNHQVVTFGALVRLTDITEFRFQVQQTVGANPLASRYAFRPFVDYGNGWKLWVTDLKVDDSSSISARILANVDASTTGTVELAGMFAWINGWEMFPHQNIFPKYVDSAAPTTGTWAVGDVVWNSAPASAGYIGWVCTVAGSPGTWQTWGLIS